jgi:uncharacterized protein (DUF1800 family)
MGVDYPPGGQAQGEAALDFLAAHPATARLVAAKLVRHFVPEEPAALVETLAETFETTDGDLGAVAAALIDSDLAWSDPTRLTSPQEFLWFALRALARSLEPRQITQGLGALGQPLWSPPSPQGFNDAADAWLAPDALTNRLDFAETLAVQVEPDVDPVALAAAILGPGMARATELAVARAESRTQALALMLMSPEFQRR